MRVNKYSLFFILAGFSVTLVSGYWFQKPSFIWFDFLQRFSAQETLPKHTALIKIDQRTLDVLSESSKIYFPFPRELYGTAIQKLEQVGVRGIVFDILYTEPSVYGHEDDLAFKEAIQNSSVPIFLPGKSSGGTIKDPIPELKSVVEGLGTVEMMPESDGIMRRGLLGKLSFSESIALHFKVPFSPPQEESFLSFFEMRSFPTISFYELLTLDASKLNHLKNRLVFLAYTAPGLLDLKPTPIDKNSPGVIYHLTYLENRLNNQFIESLSKWVNGSLFFIFCFFQIMAIRSLSRPVSSMVFILFFPTATILIASMFMFFFYSYWLNPIPLLLGLLASGLSMLLLKFQDEWRERIRFARSLEHSMSKEMVGLIKNGSVQVERFGEERNVAIFFCDLEGFTGLSEKHTPIDLVEILNSFLDEAVSCITSNHGYVDKFIGDAIMALWGAPLRSDKDATNCIYAAVAIRKLMYQKQYPFKLRIGLHYGKTVVGNIGSHERHNYTAIGDSVNLASRLEGIAKQYGVEIIFSEELMKKANVKDHLGFVEIDNIKVKGRSTETRIFTHLLSEEEKFAKPYLEALNQYYEGRWKEAGEIFESIKIFSPANVMAERCRKLISGERNSFSKGVWIYDEK